MFRIAAIIALAGWATSAGADPLTWKGLTSTTERLIPSIASMGAEDGNLPTSAALPTTPKYCESGWTMVYVQNHDGWDVAKCAAVGDLKDPER
jgi:hypothetical protein